MNPLVIALEASAILYINWKITKKLYKNQFDQVIEPYKREILKRCEEQRVSEVTPILAMILEERAAPGYSNDFILYSAAAADIMIRRKMQQKERERAMPKPSNN